MLRGMKHKMTHWEKWRLLGFRIEETLLLVWGSLPINIINIFAKTLYKMAFWLLLVRKRKEKDSYRK